MNVFLSRIRAIFQHLSVLSWLENKMILFFPFTSAHVIHPAWPGFISVISCCLSFLFICLRQTWSILCISCLCGSWTGWTLAIIKKSAKAFMMVLTLIIQNILAKNFSEFKSFLFTFFLQVPERLYQLVDRSTDGLVTADQVMEFIAGLQSIR